MPKIWKTIEVELDIDDLEDHINSLEDDDLITEMESRGFTCVKDGPATFDHVDHLIVCGQLEEAKDEALRLVAELIGREFK